MKPPRAPLVLVAKHAIPLTVLAVVHFLAWAAVPMALAWLVVGGDLRFWVLGFGLVVVLYEGARVSANVEHLKARGILVEKS